MRWGQGAEASVWGQVTVHPDCFLTSLLHTSPHGAAVHCSCCAQAWQVGDRLLRGQTRRCHLGLDPGPPLPAWTLQGGGPRAASLAGQRPASRVWMAG